MTNSLLFHLFIIKIKPQIPPQYFDLVNKKKKKKKRINKLIISCRFCYYMFFSFIIKTKLSGPCPILKRK